MRSRPVQRFSSPQGHVITSTPKCDIIPYRTQNPQVHFLERSSIKNKTNTHQSSKFFLHHAIKNIYTYARPHHAQATTPTRRSASIPSHATHTRECTRRPDIALVQYKVYQLQSPNLSLPGPVPSLSYNQIAIQEMMIHRRFQRPTEHQRSRRKRRKR